MYFVLGVSIKDCFAPLVRLSGVKPVQTTLISEAAGGNESVENLAFLLHERAFYVVPQRRALAIEHEFAELILRVQLHIRGKADTAFVVDEPDRIIVVEDDVDNAVNDKPHHILRALVRSHHELTNEVIGESHALVKVAVNLPGKECGFSVLFFFGQSGVIDSERGEPVSDTFELLRQTALSV